MFLSPYPGRDTELQPDTRLVLDPLDPAGRPQLRVPRLREGDPCPGHRDVRGRAGIRIPFFPGILPFAWLHVLRELDSSRELLFPRRPLARRLTLLTGS